MSDADPSPPTAAYFELSWAILSTIGITNLFFSFIVIGLVGFTPISLVPIIVSVAGAIANGLCYYAFYAGYPEINTAVASAFADMAWLIQEAGLSFYSYVILARVLRNRSRAAFQVIFWTIMAVIASLRVAIMVNRLRYVLGHSAAAELQLLIDHLHVGYFACIAVVECASAAFLLHTFNAARRISMAAAIRSGLFGYLVRSTEIRLALLALVGVTRAVTYSFQSTAQSATGVAGQLDRFAYTLECVFPMMMLIDILASRLMSAKETHASSRSGGPASMARGTKKTKMDDEPAFSSHPSDEDLELAGHRAHSPSSQHRIVGGRGPSGGAASPFDSDEDRALRTPGRIQKTVDFKVFEVRE